MKRTKNRFLFFVSGFLFPVFAGILMPAFSPKLHAAEIRLFNGKNLEGWIPVSAQPQDPKNPTWTVKDGNLVCMGLPMGYLRCKTRWKDFVLSLDWLYPKGSQGLNSGLLIRLQEPDQVWPFGLEVQLHQGDAGDLLSVEGFSMATAPERRQGRRALKIGPSQEKSPGTWNHLDLTLKGENLSLAVNGVLTNSASGLKIPEGFLALQAEGGEVRFRDLRLRVLR